MNIQSIYDAAELVFKYGNTNAQSSQELLDNVPSDEQLYNVYIGCREMVDQAFYLLREYYSDKGKLND